MGVYIDGHERADVVKCRQEEFIPRWISYERRLLRFQEDGSHELPSILQPGEKPFIFITHIESTFLSNDGKQRMWIEDGKQPLRPKVRLDRV